MNEEPSEVMESKRSDDSARASDAPAAEAPATEGTAADAPASEGAGGDAAAAGGESSGGDAARKRRRRGRRGGRRHKKKPAAGAAGSDDPASDAEDNGDDGDEGGDEAEAASTQSAPRQQQRQRQPQQQRQRQPRAPKPAPEPDASGETGGAKRAEPVAEEASPVEAEAATAEGDEAAEGAEGTEGAPRPARKRRRRRRSGAKKPAENGQAAEQDGAQADEAKPAAKTTQKSAAKSGAKSAAKTEKADTAPPSTRLAARALRREKQRSQGRRRPRRLTDEEVAQLRGGAKTMLVHSHEDRTQIAVLEEGMLIEHYVSRKGQRTTMAGNVYLGKVQNVLPGMEAAFVDFGRGRNGVLYAGEVNYSAEDLDNGQVPRIEKVLRPGQAVMVQVTKDPIGSKGARLTSQISLAGRYLVLAPEQQVSGISRRLADNERSRLRGILRDIAPKEHGVIVRTAAEGATREQIELDLKNLIKIWDEVGKAAKKGKAPATLYEEPELTTRVVRDIFSGDFERVVVDSRPVYEELRTYLEETAPDMIDRLTLYDGALPLFEEHRVSEQIHKALERKVWLPSGGSIVIDRTEALTVVDVNTGKFTGKGGNLEETVYKNNCEAAEEVARQLRLRDIGGIIVIDFIDMIDPKHQTEVLRTLKRALAKDKTRSQVFEISNLGLVEMTRKKVSEGLLEAFSEPCPNCVGRGIVITHEID